MDWHPVDSKSRLLLEISCRCYVQFAHIPDYSVIQCFLFEVSSDASVLLIVDKISTVLD